MSKVILKRSSIAGKVPLVTDLDYGELAINYADGIAYFKKSDNTIGTIGGVQSAQILLDTIKTVDGTGSGLDADLLDGQSGAYYIDWTNTTNKPTTLAGYGITDAAAATHNHNGTYQPLDNDLSAIAALAGTSGFLKKTAADTWSLDTSTYLTGNQSITVSGDATGSGTTSIALTLANSGVVAGTYTKVTVDAKGRVTTGASLASADLPTYTGTITSSQVTTALGYTPYNSTNPNGYTTNTGTVTSIGGTGTVSGLTLTGTVTTTGNLTLGGTLAVTPANFASQTANTVLAAPNGAAGAPTFRSLVAADIPNLDAAKITSGVLDAARLPSYVDDVLEYAALASFPATGETGKIYVDLTTNKTYRWSGSVYVYITSGAVDSVAGKTGVVTLVKGDVGLGSVDNTADAAKNVLSATKLTTARTINGVSFDGSANITLTATATNALTIGSYLTGTSYNGSSAVTIAVDATNLNTASKVVARDASGNFSAGTITAALSGNATTATTLATSRNINGVSFNGSADITITAANPNALTIGTGLSGTSYNGSSAVTIALASGYGDTQNPYASKTANYFLAAPNGTAGAPTFRAIVAADIPTLNQNTTGSAASVVGTVAGTNATDLVYGNMADNDQFRIRIGGTATNAGWVELATADDGTEPIYVRQYTGVFTTVARTATLLDGSGNTSFPGTVTANGVTLTGNTGTVTSVGGTGTVSGLTLTGTVTTSGNLTLGGTLSVTPSNFASQTANTVLAAPNGSAGTPTFRALVAADIPTLNQNTTGTASNVTGTVAIANGGTGATTAAAARTNLGATTLGSNLFTITNPSAVTFPRFNADNTVSTLDAATFRTAIGAQASGSYLTAESDTLATVTARGATTSGTIATPGTEGVGYAFWNDTTNYKIHMGVTAGTYQYGPVTDYSMRFTMGGGTGRGFTWGYAGSAPIAALNAYTGNMQIAGTFSAASKSFLIPHPTKPGKQLRYGSLEGPENGVYVRGKLTGNNTIELPEYWTKLVDPDSITVNLTCIGKYQKLYVMEIKDNKVYVGNENLWGSDFECFYTVYGERVDVDKLEVEID